VLGNNLFFLNKHSSNTHNTTSYNSCLLYIFIDWLFDSSVQLEIKSSKLKFILFEMASANVLLNPMRRNFMKKYLLCNGPKSIFPKYGLIVKDFNLNTHIKSSKPHPVLKRVVTSLEPRVKPPGYETQKIFGQSFAGFRLRFKIN
jgi:hypothetical protein